MIFQSVALSDTLASIWMLADFPVAGVQAESVCKGPVNKARHYIIAKAWMLNLEEKEKEKEKIYK